MSIVVGRQEVSMRMVVASKSRHGRLLPNHTL